MRKKIFLTAMITSMLIYALSSCYRNKEDITALPRVSFRSEVVPIVTAGPCGCHNNGTTRAIQFSHLDTIFYDAILGRVGLFNTWVNGGTHPGGGAIDFAPNEKNIIKRWLAQGDPYDDGSGCTISGNLRYTTDILPIYNVTCKGSTCHGGIAIVLDYNKMVAEKATITAMMNSNGAQGHPGGTLSLTTCTINKFKEWINQGQPQ
ncbi:MAG: hypothetical protein HYZ15_13725 [Sphingobacteriales bacterium]|nr:hypothetical protein [Sphingobacteriales bacterium]